MAQQDDFGWRMALNGCAARIEGLLDETERTKPAMREPGGGGAGRATWRQALVDILGVIAVLAVIAGVWLR